MCSSVDITAYEARKRMFKPFEVKLRKYPMVRTIRESMNRLMASHMSIPLVNPQYMVCKLFCMVFWIIF